MLLKIVAQILLSASMLQFFPYDVAVLESFTDGSKNNITSSSVEHAFTYLHQGLPVSADKPQAPSKVRPTSLGVVTSAQSAIVVDKASNEILFEKNTNESRAIGSITKLMSAIVFLEMNSNLNDRAEITSEDIRLGGKQHLVLGDSFTIRDLLLASLISSDNTATMSLVRLSGLSLAEFVAQMNKKAGELGMSSTIFVDPTGLSSDNRSTVFDILSLLNVSLSEIEIRNATEAANKVIVGVSGREYLIETTNDLLNTFLNQYPYKIIGGKTGFLPEAGYCLGIQVQENDGHDVFIVVLGSETTQSRFHDVKMLAAWTYQTFLWPGESSKL